MCKTSCDKGEGRKEPPEHLVPWFRLGAQLGSPKGWGEFPCLRCRGTTRRVKHVLGKTQQKSMWDTVLPFRCAKPQQINEYFNKEIFH